MRPQTTRASPMMDRRLLCTQCGRPFVFTAAEQVFFAEHGLRDPKRCRPCRDSRRRAPVVLSALPEPASPDKSAQRTGADACISGEYHTIRCVDCGSSAQVPFRPLAGRPVFCPACHRARRGLQAEAMNGTLIEAQDEGIIE